MSPTPDQHRPGPLEILVAGDIHPGGRLDEIAPDRLFADLTPLFAEADLRLANVEFPVGSRKTPIVKSGPAFLCPAASVALLHGRFDVALLANNHILDNGPGSVVETIAALRQTGLRTVGAGPDRMAAERPLSLERKGLRIAILNLCEQEFNLATETSAGAAGLRPFATIARIRDLRQRHDIVLVCTHGGNEYNPFPSPRMVAMLRAFADAGATAVVNSHPHIPQGIETWNGVPIVYSVGNFIFPLHPDEKPESPLWWLGMPVRLVFRRGRGGVTATAHPVPVMLDNRTLTLRRLAGARRRHFDHWLDTVSAPLADERRIEALFDAWAAHWGAIYFAHVAFAASTGATRTERTQFARFRNLWACEAHHELIARHVDLVLNHRLGQARKRWPEINACLSIPTGR